MPQLVALTYQTFLLPLPRVRQATRAVLQKMRLEIHSGESGPPEAPGTILADGEDRQLEIELQPTGARATRLRVIAKDRTVRCDNTATQFLGLMRQALEG